MTGELRVAPWNGDTHQALTEVEGIDAVAVDDFARQHAGASLFTVAGTVALGLVALRESDGRFAWRLRDDLAEPDAVRVVTAAVEHALALVPRVETRLPADDTRARRTAGRAGFRQEGVVRGVDGDEIQLARLRTDAAPGEPGAFIDILNAGLPRKRVIAQAIVQDPHDRILLCELTYKKFWDLPGGVVDPFEPPAGAVRRELHEELGVHAQLHDLAAVSWLPPWRGWDDAVLFVFRARIDHEPRELERREIRNVHWATREEAAEKVAPYTLRVIDEALAAGEVRYLEDGRPPF